MPKKGGVDALGFFHRKMPDGDNQSNAGNCGQAKGSEKAVMDTAECAAYFKHYQYV
jgi:hypothetical protein